MAGASDKGDKPTADFSNVKSGASTRDASSDFSNVRSGSSSTAPGASPATGAEKGSGARTYTVLTGDSLSKIARQEYGDASKWRQIYEANSDTIKNPDLIYPGQTLRLP